MNNTAYFATDGSFGDAKDLELIDVSQWTEADWNEVQDEADEYRIATARLIAQRYVERVVLDSVYVNGDLIDYDDNGNPLEAD
jgi:hypothetical protein